MKLSGPRMIATKNAKADANTSHRRFIGTFHGVHWIAISIWLDYKILINLKTVRTNYFQIRMKKKTNERTVTKSNQY